MASRAQTKPTSLSAMTPPGYIDTGSGLVSKDQATDEDFANAIRLLELVAWFNGNVQATKAYTQNDSNGGTGSKHDYMYRGFEGRSVAPPPTQQTAAWTSMPSTSIQSMPTRPEDSFGPRAYGHSGPTCTVPGQFGAAATPYWNGNNLAVAASHNTGNVVLHGDINGTFNNFGQVVQATAPHASNEFAVLAAPNDALQPTTMPENMYPATRTPSPPTHTTEAFPVLQSPFDLPEADPAPENTFSNPQPPTSLSTAPAFTPLLPSQPVSHSSTTQAKTQATSTTGGAAADQSLEDIARGMNGWMYELFSHPEEQEEGSFVFVDENGGVPESYVRTAHL